uniref:Uncharacterized protein n=1 Tax=Ditylenchus dipsaci TaxID=166011 RepID=A0A915CQI1_9BILA
MEQKFLQYKSNAILIEIACVLTVFILSSMMLFVENLATGDVFVANAIAFVMILLIIFLLVLRNFMEKRQKSPPPLNRFTNFCWCCPYFCLHVLCIPSLFL